MPKNANKLNWLQLNVIRLSRVHFWLAAVFALSIIVAHASKLITPQAVLARWSVAAVMLAATSVIWYVARQPSKSRHYYAALVYVLIVIDIYLASYLVYAERGMASRAVALYAIPIAVSAVLLRPRAIFATAAICIAAYSFSAVRYFVINFNEGYMAELYATIAFYSSIFLLLAGILSVAVRTNDR